MLMFHRVLTVNTPIGRRMRPRLLRHAGPVVRVKPKDLAAAGVERVPKVVGVRNGLPVLEDQRALKVANVIWCTGFRPDFSWIDLPVFADEIEPEHQRGIVGTEPGLYFVGLFFSTRPHRGWSVAWGGTPNMSSTPSLPGQAKIGPLTASIRPPAWLTPPACHRQATVRRRCHEGPADESDGGAPQLASWPRSLGLAETGKVKI